MKGMSKKINASSPKNLTNFYCHYDILFILTNFQMSDKEMEKGTDVRTMSAEIFEIVKTFGL